MLTGYTLHRPGQPSVDAFADLPRKPSLADLRNLLTPLLGTAEFEHVAVANGDMFVDENGLSRKLPRNDRATALYRAAWLRRHPGTHPESLAAIYGPAVVFDRQVWF